MNRFFSALCCGLLLAACSKVSDTTAGSPTPGGLHSWSHPGELRIAIQRAPNTLNPLLAANTTEGMINRLSFDVLISANPDGKLVPVLVTEIPTSANGGISADGLTIKYKLRSGVKWQDGVPFTSKDVKFSWQAMMNDNNNVNSRTGYDAVKSVETPDATTVIFHLKHKFAPFVTTVFSESDDDIAVVPEHILGKYKDINRIPFNTLPIGTGPFKVVRWVRGDHIELAANPDYFRGAPKLKTITIREIPDENTSINSLRTHDVDWMFEPSPNLYNVLKTLADIKIHFVDQPQTLNMQINTSRPLLRDLRVRRAIAYAIDKKSLVDKFTGGSARVAGADQPPFSWAYEPNVTQYGPDTAKAKSLLIEAGYKPGSDGIMTKNGQPLSLQLSTNSENATRRLVETQVQAELKAVGIDAQIKNYPANLFFATYGQGGVQTTGKYDLAIAGWIAGLDPDDHSLYTCDQIPKPSHPDGVNYTRYCSKEMDAEQTAALSTYDQAARKPHYSAIQKLLARDVPEIWFWYSRNPQATNPDFKGFTPNPVNEAWNAYQWEM
ncbi:MAG: peptide ABC transporter substrate-binding protein [Candidatus Velthaea sp.]